MQIIVIVDMANYSIPGGVCIKMWVKVVLRYRKYSYLWSLKFEIQL